MIHPEDHDRVVGVFAGREPGDHRVIELRARDGEGRWRWLEIVATDLREIDEVGGIAANVRDVSERHEEHEELHHLAHHDPLTSLPNRHALRARLDEVVAASEGRATVMWVDLDGFKRVNDRHGHAVGDDVLIEVSERLRSVTRDGDMVARFGGDEFVFVSPAVADQTEAAAIAERIRAVFTAPFDLPGGRSIDIGVAVSWTGATGEDLLRTSDDAMYTAKSRGAAGPSIHGAG